MNNLTIRNTLVILCLIFLHLACSIKQNRLPEEFYGFKLKKKLTGLEAKKFVDELHFNSVAPEKNEIGFYESPAGKVIIYITYYDDDSKSFSEYEKMINKITPENSVFYNPEIINIEEKEIYRCSGMGQVHYVFANKKELYWISIDPQFRGKFIEEYLQLIK